jgi:hypothetical protein
VSALMSANAEVPDLPIADTAVARVSRATLTNDQDVAMLGIDASTFEEGVYWQEEYSDESLDDLLDAISEEGTEPRAIAVGPVPAHPAIGSARGDIEVEVVGHADTFPGRNSESSMLVVSREAFDEVLTAIGPALSSRESELWARGTEARVRATLQRNKIPFFTVLSSEAVLETPALQSMLWTLGLLGALGAASGLAAVAGLLLYVQARHRSALISSAMTRRMKLDRAAELRASFLEVGATMGIAYLLAVAIGLGVAALMHQRLDLRPTLDPAPILVVPVGIVGLAALAVAVLAWLTAMRLRKQVDDANIAEVLRT